MTNPLRSSLGRWVIWLVLLLSFVIVRPRPFTLAFWAWTAVVVGAGLLQMHQARVEALAEREAFVQWSDRLAGLGALRDVEDDGHLYEWLGSTAMAGGVRRPGSHAGQCAEPPVGHTGHAPGRAAVR